MPEPAEHPPDARRPPSRRTAIVSAAAVVAAAAIGIPTSIGLLHRTSTATALVPELLAKPHFYAAHRGGSLDWPEMSFEGYRKSVALGADALEVSLARTSDGVWFGLHDATLDRTSGTHDFVASEHTWAEVQRYRITAAQTNDPSQASQPYMRLETLLDAYAGKHAIFVDPKAVNPDHYGELLRILERAVSTPRTAFIAKGYCTMTQWPDAARRLRLQSWGFYYANEVLADRNMLPSTQSHWSTLGMDYDGAAEGWALARSYHKLLIGHVIPNAAGAEEAFSRGARGAMCSGIREVLAGRPSADA